MVITQSSKTIYIHWSILVSFCRLLSIALLLLVGKCFPVIGCFVPYSLSVVLTLWPRNVQHPCHLSNFGLLLNIRTVPVFDRFAIIWLENTDYSAAFADREFPLLNTCVICFNQQLSFLFFKQTSMLLPSKASCWQTTTDSRILPSPIMWPLLEETTLAWTTTTWTVSLLISLLLLICSKREVSVGVSTNRTCPQPATRVTNISTRTERTIMFANTSESVPKSYNHRHLVWSHFSLSLSLKPLDYIWFGSRQYDTQREYQEFHFVWPRPGK